MKRPSVRKQRDKIRIKAWKIYKSTKVEDIEEVNKARNSFPFDEQTELEYHLSLIVWEYENEK